MRPYWTSSGRQVVPPKGRVPRSLGQALPGSQRLVPNPHLLPPGYSPSSRVFPPICCNYFFRVGGIMKSGVGMNSWVPIYTRSRVKSPLVGTARFRVPRCMVVSVLSSCVFMGSTRSGSYFQGVNSLNMQATLRRFDPKDPSRF